MSLFVATTANPGYNKLVSFEASLYSKRSMVTTPVHSEQVIPVLNEASLVARQAS